MDGICSATGSGFEDEVDWARWPVTFPAGEDVRLRVTYDTYPVGRGPWGTFHYILESDAGWHGPIGEGSITFRLPYEVTGMNMQLAEIREAYTGPDRPFEIAVDGSDVIWRFTDLEPRRSEPVAILSPSTETDNPMLPLLAPAVWAEVEAARVAAEEEPDSVEAQLRLAQALKAATQRNKGFLATEANAALIEHTDAAYRRAVELAPEDVEVLVAYVEWLAIPRNQEGGGAKLGESLDSILSRALELAPDHPRVRDTEEWVEQWRQNVATATPTSTPTTRSSPRPTRTPLPSPSATSTSTPAPTAEPAAAATPTPNPLTPGGVCPGAFALAGLVAAFWALRG